MVGLLPMATRTPTPTPATTADSVSDLDRLPSSGVITDLRLAGHMSKECTEPRKKTGACFNCGEIG